MDHVPRQSTFSAASQGTEDLRTAKVTGLQALLIVPKEAGELRHSIRGSRVHNAETGVELQEILRFEQNVISSIVILHVLEAMKK